MSADATIDSRPETCEHIAEVRGLVLGVAGNLVGRGHRHDASKLVEPEVGTFDRVTAQLRSLTYGSDEYEAARASMGPALEHHYAANDHHPEHFPPGTVHEVDVGTEPAFHPSGDEYTVASAVCSGCDWTDRGDEEDVVDAAAMHEREHYAPGGIHAMNVIQLTEMLCDWIAATRRHDDDKDIHDSIEFNAKRFGYGDTMARLLHNSADAILASEVKVPVPVPPTS
jgi:hypothetical protein